MSQVVRELVAVAAGGAPVYISTVRAAFEALPVEGSFVLRVGVDGFGGDDRVYRLRLPHLAPLAPDERALVEEYVLAALYNVISTVGGRGLSLRADGAHGTEGADLAAVFERAFGVGAASRLARPGYGRAVNVSERMDEAVSPPDAPSLGRFTVRLAEDGATDAADAADADAADAVGAGASVGAMGAAARATGRIADLCDLSTGGFDGTTICGIDIGGTDIKLALAVDGKAVRFVEYDWFPAAFHQVAELIDPVIALARLLRLEAACMRGATPDAAALAAALAPAYAHGVDTATILAAVAAGEPLADPAFTLDAIGVCFPDVVVKDRIVGGEVYKTRGMRNHLGAQYEEQFRRLTVLNDLLAPLVRADGVVGIVNDGPMAAFTAAVELGAVDRAAIAAGVFAHTLGTELGTGWVTEDGLIPDIPLEIYNCVIDLGSYPERAFPPDDVRSVNNFNTLVAGTLQKYTSQSGVFRLAAKYLPAEDPALLARLFADGLLVEHDGALLCPTEPRDMRKPLLEALMAAADDGSHPAVDRIFREVGEFLAVAWLESRWLLDPAASDRILFGRLVKRRSCFALMVEGARAIAPGLRLVVADDELANTPLMRQLRDDGRYTVAQFAQAIGAIHYGNLRRRLAAGATA